MLSSLADYWLKQLRPRFATTFGSSEALLAAAAGVAVGLFGHSVGLANARVGDIVVAILTYAAVAFGFCVAALTIALTAPRPRMAIRLATTTREGGPIGVGDPGNDSYSNLLFIFSWTAIAHWFVIIGSVGLLVALGSDLPFVAEGSSAQHRAAVGLFAAATIYAIEMFAITVISLAGLGEVHVASLRAEASEQGEQGSSS